MLEFFFDIMSTDSDSSSTSDDSSTSFDSDSESVTSFGSDENTSITHFDSSSSESEQEHGTRKGKKNLTKEQLNEPWLMTLPLPSRISSLLTGHIIQQPRSVTPTTNQMPMHRNQLQLQRYQNDAVDCNRDPGRGKTSCDQPSLVSDAAKQFSM